MQKFDVILVFILLLVPASNIAASEPVSDGSALCIKPAETAANPKTAKKQARLADPVEEQKLFDNLSAIMQQAVNDHTSINFPYDENGNRNRAQTPRDFTFGWHLKPKDAFPGGWSETKFGWFGFLEIIEKRIRGGELATACRTVKPVKRPSCWATHLHCFCFEDRFPDHTYGEDLGTVRQKIFELFDCSSAE